MVHCLFYFHVILLVIFPVFYILLHVCVFIHFNKYLVLNPQSRSKIRSGSARGQKLHQSPPVPVQILFHHYPSPQNCVFVNKNLQH